MSKYFLKPQQAVPLLKEIAVQSRKWGKNLKLPYSQAQIVEAIQLADDQGLIAGANDGPTKEEVTLLRRQLAACQNREKARTKRKESGNEPA